MRHPFAFIAPARRAGPGGGVPVERRALSGLLGAVAAALRRPQMAQRPPARDAEGMRRPGEGDEAFDGRMKDLDAAKEASRRAREAEDKFQKDKTPENGERMAEAQEEEALRQHQYNERHTWPDDIARRETLEFWRARMVRYKALKEAFRQLRREREARGMTLLFPYEPPAFPQAVVAFPPPQPVASMPVAPSFAWRGWPAGGLQPVAAPAQPAGVRYTPEGWSSPFMAPAPATVVTVPVPFFSPFGLPAASGPVSAVSFG